MTASCAFFKGGSVVRTYAEKLPIEEAVERAINECIQENILKDFLEVNRAEAMKVSIYEYNEQEHMRMEREDAFEDGRKVGLDEGRMLGLDEGRMLGLDEGRNLGLSEGREAERTQIFTLMSKMAADGLGDQTSRLASDPDFYQDMVKKYLV